PTGSLPRFVMTNSALNPPGHRLRTAYSVLSTGGGLAFGDCGASADRRGAPTWAPVEGGRVAPRNTTSPSRMATATANATARTVRTCSRFVYRIGGRPPCPDSTPPSPAPHHTKSAGIRADGHHPTGMKHPQASALP